MRAQWESWEEFDNCSEFTLICSATGSSQVNLIPIYHLGAKRIKGLILQHGTSGNPQNDADQLQGGKSRIWMEDFARNTLGLPKNRVKIVLGHSDRVVDQWAESARLAESWAMPVLYNLSSGTAQMTAATLDTLNAKQIPFTSISVDKSPSRLRITGLIGNAIKDRVLDGADIAAFVPLKILDKSKGLVLDRTDKKAAEIHFFDSLNSDAEIIWDRIVQAGPKGRNALSAIGGAMQNKSYMLQNLGAQELTTIEAVFNTGGPAWNGGHLIGDAVQFFKGGWLEQYVYSQCKGAIADCGTITLFPGLEVSAPNQPTRGEIDLVVFERDVPHIVEIKAQLETKVVNDFDSKVQSWLDRLGTLRATLGGLPSKAWLIAPFLKFSGGTEVESDLMKRAEDASVRLYVGHDAVKKLCEDLRKMAAAE